LALATVAFALGIGAAALWLQPAAQNSDTASTARAAAPPGSGALQSRARGALALKLDVDAAGFAARAASRVGKAR
jgi:hypothetical protein